MTGMTGALFFDLDGTLTDPKVGIVRCIGHALDALGVPVPADDDLLWCIGPPLRTSFAQMLGGETRVEQAIQLYRERFSTIGMFENAVYDGVPELLGTLNDRGHRLFVATSKPHVYAAQILDHFELSGFFERVFGAELDGVRADKTDLLAYAIRETKVQPETAWMIGDRKHDIIGARANAVNAVGVLYGYGSRDELEQADAHALVARPSELVQVLHA